MLTEHIAAAMRRATYRQLEDGEGYSGEIPGLAGVRSNVDTLEETREDVRQALEGWLVLGLRLGHPIPVLDRIDLAFAAADCCPRSARSAGASWSPHCVGWAGPAPSSAPTRTRSRWPKAPGASDYPTLSGAISTPTCCATSFGRAASVAPSGNRSECGAAEPIRAAPSRRRLPPCGSATGARRCRIIGRPCAGRMVSEGRGTTG